MATHREPPLSEPEAEIALAGWDPYIVAITGGVAYDPTCSAADDSGRDTAAPESRELRLMAWLREQNATR